MQSSSPGQEERDEAARALARAFPLPVVSARLAVVTFGREHLHKNCPLPRYTLSFQENSYLHFKQEYNADWWIGRVVGVDYGLGFLPSEAKLREAVAEDSGQKTYEKEVYQWAPIMRPVVLLGPSCKESHLTELLQKALVGFIRERFVGRLCSVKPSYSVCNMTEKEERMLEEEVCRAGSGLQLVFLDSDISFPEDIHTANIHPMFVYVKIARQKVLYKLLEQLTRQSKDQQSEISAAHRLHEQSGYALTLADSNLDDACQTLELFLEHYWATTRSVFPLPCDDSPSPAGSPPPSAAAATELTVDT